MKPFAASLIFCCLAAFATSAPAGVKGANHANGSRPHTLLGTPRSVAPNKLGSQQALAILQSERDKFWLNAREEVYRSTLELIAQDQSEVDKGVHFRKIMHGNRTVKKIALTFDDGPHPAFTPQILKILKQNNVKATFFLVGEMAEKYPWLVRQEVNDGHAIGNHTYHHVSLIKIPQDSVATEIDACDKVIQAITGKKPWLFRPPGGEYNRNVVWAYQTLGHTMVLWTDDPGDYNSPGRSVIEERVLDKIDEGGIILIHDGIQQTINILPDLIRKSKMKGYEFVTVDKFASKKDRP